MQSDGNLVVYRTGGSVVWASNTAGKGASFVGCQSDGNVVIYRNTGGATWSTGTTGCPSTRLVMQDDGNLVAYDTTGRAVWASRDGFIADRLLVGQHLTAGQQLTSVGNHYRLVMQGDGNLVAYTSTGHVVWASNTAGKGPSNVVVQSDGNIVIYRNSGGATWSTNTAGAANPRFYMQADGNVVAYNNANTPVWFSGTAGGNPGIGGVGRYNARIIAGAGRYGNGYPYGQQCLVFVEDQIRYAGGPSLAMGYNGATYQSQWAQCATQQSWSTVAPGDICQWYDPNGKYGPLHTAIITGGNSPSNATVVDCNYGIPLNQQNVGRGTWASRNVGFHAGTFALWRVR